MDADLTGRCGAVFLMVWCTRGIITGFYLRETRSKPDLRTQDCD
jgi:hypothetical protein